MAIISKRSTRTFVRSLLIVSFFTFLITSCKDEEHRGPGVWIPTPPDTSALGKIDHFIPTKDLDAYRRAYASERDTLAKSNPTLYLPLSEAFNKKWLLELLKDTACVGIKIYYGTANVDDRKGKDFRLLIVGVNEQGKDLYIKKSGSPLAAQAGGGPEEDGGLEYGQCTPPCGRGSTPTQP
jgi:hypothetical protein